MFSRFIKSLLSCPFLARCVRTCQDSGARSLRSFFPGPFTLTRGIRGHLDNFFQLSLQLRHHGLDITSLSQDAEQRYTFGRPPSDYIGLFLKHDRVYE